MSAHERPNEGETNIWLTPPAIIEMLGPFDLDPCAAPEPRPWPTAKTHYAEAEGDGLSRPWFGRVWLNPPYGPHVGAWMDRLADHHNGIALVMARTDTQWFQRIVSHADAVLFKDTRIVFCYPDGTPATEKLHPNKKGEMVLGGNAGAPSCFLAYGSDNVAALRDSAIAGFFAAPIARKAPIQRQMFGGAA